MRWLLGLALAAGLALAVLWRGLAPPPALPQPERGLRLANVTVVNPGLDRAKRRSLVVEADRIVGIAPSDGGQAGDEFAGAFVLPGLTDMHVHFPPSSLPGQGALFAFLHLYHGVLAVRDAGDVDGTASGPVREGLGRGDFPGPRHRACGPYFDGPPGLWDNSRIVSNADEARRAVEAVAADDFDCIKVYDRLEAEPLAAIREAAGRLGLPVIGHIPGKVGFEASRLDDAQHLIGLIPPWPGTAPEFPHLLRGWLAFDDARLADVIEVALRDDVAHTPTLVTIERLLVQQDRAVALAEPDAHLLPRLYRDVLWNPDGGMSAARNLSAEDWVDFRAAFAVMKRTVRLLHEAGVRLHTGTDSLVAFVVPGASLHRELRLWVEAGIPAEAALAASMRTSAEFLEGEAHGVLREGAPADFLIFGEDPTADLAHLDTLRGVVRDGRLYTREALDAQLARYREHYAGFVYETLLPPIVRAMVARSLPPRLRAEGGEAPGP